MRRLLSLLVLGLGLGIGLLVAWWLLSPGRAAPPDPPAVVEKVRQVARLEALEVRLYKKIGDDHDEAREAGRAERDRGEGLQSWPPQLPFTSGSRGTRGWNDWRSAVSRDRLHRWWG